MNRIVVATGNPYTAKKIEQGLDPTESEVVSFSLDPATFLLDVNKFKPDLCIIDCELLLTKKDYNTILSRHRVPILMVSVNEENCVIYNHPLLKVISERHIETVYIQTLINYMIQVSNYIEVIELENHKLKKELHTMKLITEAKRLLMRYEGFTEPDSHKFIINKSMKHRISKDKVCENVIKKYKPFS